MSKSLDLQRLVIPFQVPLSERVADRPEERNSSYFPTYFVTGNELSPQQDNLQRLCHCPTCSWEYKSKGYVF